MTSVPSHCIGAWWSVAVVLICPLKGKECLMRHYGPYDETASFTYVMCTYMMMMMMMK